MEKKFWLITMIFFVTVLFCFLMIASQRLPETISPAVASPQQIDQPVQEQIAPVSDLTKGNSR